MSIEEKLRNWLSEIFGSLKIDNSGISSEGGVSNRRPSSDYVRPTPTATPTPDHNPTLNEIIQAMQQGSVGDPVATMSSQMAETGKDMPIYQKHPFLPIATSQLESRGFKDFSTNPLVTKPKQGFGWAVNAEGYNPNIEKVLQDMMSAVGTDRSDETNPVRLRNASYYKKFRETGDINDYANAYAGPITKQNPNAGAIYASNLKYVMNKYAEILDKIMQLRGASYSTRY